MIHAMTYEYSTHTQTGNRMSKSQSRNGLTAICAARDVLSTRRMSPSSVLRLDLNKNTFHRQCINQRRNLETQINNYESGKVPV